MDLSAESIYIKNLKILKKTKINVSLNFSSKFFNLMKPKHSRIPTEQIPVTEFELQWTETTFPGPILYFLLS